MGLDTVELVMEVEDAFDISLADKDCEVTVTVGALHALIIRQLGKRVAHGRCLTAHTFYCLRQGLEAAGVSRCLIYPAASLDELIPPRQRQKVLSQIELQSGLRLPKLQSPIPVALAALLIPLMFAFAAALSDPVFPISLVLFAVTLIIAGVVAARLNRFWQTELIQVVTFADLVRQVSALNSAKIAAAVGGLAEREVWQSLVTIICHQLGVTPDRVRPETSFVDDLHAD